MYSKKQQWRAVEFSHADESTRRDIDASFQFKPRALPHRTRGGSPDHDDEFMDHLFDAEKGKEDLDCSVESDGTVVDRVQFKASRKAWKMQHYVSDGRMNVRPSVDDSHLTITEADEVQVQRAPRLSESQNLGSKHTSNHGNQLAYNIPKSPSPLEISAPVVSKKSIPTPHSINRRESTSNDNEHPQSTRKIEKIVLNKETGKKKYLLRPSLGKLSPRTIGLGNLHFKRNPSPNPLHESLRTQVNQTNNSAAFRAASTDVKRNPATAVRATNLLNNPAIGQR